MLTSARITDELRPAELDWITALRAPQIKALVEPRRCSCRCLTNRPRRDQLARTFPGSGWCAAATPPWPTAHPHAKICWPPPKTSCNHRRATRRARRPLRGIERIALRVGKVINLYKMAKHFHHRDHRLTRLALAQPGLHRRRGRLDASSAAHQPARHSSSPASGGPLQGLEDVERFFRTLNSDSTCVPSATGWPTGARHMFLRMLSYYISWHMKQALAPILFRRQRQTRRSPPNVPSPRRAQRSDAALAKAARKRTPETPRAQLHQPARRFGHHLRQPDPAHRRHATFTKHHTHPVQRGLRTARRLPPSRTA